jgi:hypothetical protein
MGLGTEIPSRWLRGLSGNWVHSVSPSPEYRISIRTLEKIVVVGVIEYVRSLITIRLSRSQVLPGNIFECGRF